MDDLRSGVMPNGETCVDGTSASSCLSIWVTWRSPSGPGCLRRNEMGEGR